MSIVHIHTRIASFDTLLFTLTTRQDMENFTMERLRYGVIFNYPKAIDLAARRTLGVRLEEINKLFGGEKHRVLAWVSLQS